MIGERIGSWIIDSQVGANDMGRLFRAHAADDSSRLVAVKVIAHAKAASPEFEKLFLAQIELLRKLKHPAIVAVVEGGIHGGTPWFALEWVNGSDCQTLLRQGDKPGWAGALTAALKIVPALRYAHRRGVLHRDLKPSNLFRCTDGSYKLSDFGIVKFFGDALLANADNPLGSAAFLSPEQAAGKPYTKRSDFYSLGCLLWALIVGRPPFTGVTVVELIHKHCFALPERPLHYVPDMPEEIDRLVMKLLAKEPAQRPGSGTLLIQELDSIWSAVERRGIVGKRPVVERLDEEPDLPADEDPVSPARLLESIPHEPLPWMRRWYIVGSLFAACVLVLVWAFFWRGPSADELMARARPLLESQNPADWDKAWNDYLEPLSRKHPDKYVNEVKDAKRRIDEQGDLRRATLTAGQIRYRSEAERFYQMGLRLLQAGELRSARLVWENLVSVYGKLEDDKHWVALARAALDRLGNRDSVPARPSAITSLEELLRPVVAEVNRLRAAGKIQEADELAKAAEFLYRDDPEFETLKKMLGEEEN